MFVEHNFLWDMEFVDRINEQRRLGMLLEADEPNFIIVRGRRRIGKSALIGRVLTDKDIYYEADRTSAPNQMMQLSEVIAHRFPGFADAVYRDWRSLLTALNHRTTEKFTLCLDEFPYLAEGSPELPSVIQGLLDSGALRYNLVVCGSSQQMMYDLTHDETSPLYGRGAADFKVGPISIAYLPLALGVDAEQAVTEYSLWGGVPRYWKLRESAGSFADAVGFHLLSSYGALYEEPVRLFRDDIKDTVKTATIMSIVGSGVNRLSEIAARCGEPATNLSRPLAKLVSLGYLEKEIPYGESPKSSKRSLYRIADPFLSFYYKFVVPNRSFIELDRMDPVNHSLNIRLSSHIAYWWEHICRDAVSGNTIDGITYGEARRWWSKDAEIDVVVESLDHTTILLGECKWSDTDNAGELTRRLEHLAQALPFTQGKKVIIKLFLRTSPSDSSDNVLLPQDVLKMSFGSRPIDPSPQFDFEK